MPDFDHATTRWWYGLPALEALPRGPALSEALLVEEATHGVTRDVAWAYADALPELLGFDPQPSVLPLAFARGGLRAVALDEPIDIEGLYHVQTASPDVCRTMGARVPSFSVRGQACVEALIRHGRGVREVVAQQCVPFEANAPFQITFGNGATASQRRWFVPEVAKYFVPIVQLDLEVWLCWHRGRGRPCVVQGRDRVVEGRWGPRDVSPEKSPPPWAEPEARVLAGHGWAATMIYNHRRGGASFLADPARGWCRLSADAEPPYHENLREAWKAGRALQRVGCAPNDHGAIATLRIDGPRAHFAWLGLERVLRVRGGELVQLTIDHDLFDAARRGHAAIDPAALAALDEISAVETRGLPADAPDEGTCDVEPGDRFVLLDVLAQRELVRAAGGHDGFVARLRDGSARDVARWMRAVLVHERVELPVVVIDADASLEARSHGAPRVSSAATTARDLVERPAEFNGWRVRFRGVYRRGMEVSTIADAWFEGTCGLGDGTWAVEAEGLWIHDGGQHGHFGQWASELRGTLTPIDLAHPRSIPPDRIGSAEPYVAYTSEIVIERGLLHWWHEGRWVTRFGRDGRFPLADPPERCRVRATFVPGAYGHLGIVEWTILDTEPLAPTRRTAASPGREGEYVEIEGMLVPTKDYPRLDDALRVSPPSLTRSPLRHTIPQHEAAARFREILGAGRRVTVRGEMGPSALLALAVFDESGPIDL